MVAFYPFAVAFLAAFLYSPLENLFESRENVSERYLLLTAHPDDEAMFFAPTILGLAGRTPDAEVRANPFEQVVLSARTPSSSPLYSLCLSLGNADGLGGTRRDELFRSLDVLGVDADKRWIVDHPDLQDNITALWDPVVIADVIKPYVVQHGITTILTFDSKGISDHPNHKALPLGVKHLFSTLTDKPRLFTLISLPIYNKFTGFFGAFLGKFDLCASKVLVYYDGLINRGLEHAQIIAPGSAPNVPEHFFMPVFVSGVKGYATAFKAMLAHKSQLVWFRWLYLLFSRYMWINEWVEVKV
ncbi:hypothetical protein NMY22_g6675 [Coprinellus aureogranulatus]|nr:hypothetical protein NMY22_g6675 [Coprinellus aureogranulatus]